MSSSRLGNTREIRDIFHFCAIHFLWERKSAMVLIYISYFHYLDLIVSRSLLSLANYKYSTLPRGISIHIAPKVGIFPEAQGQGKIHYKVGNIIDILQGWVEY